MLNHIFHTIAVSDTWENESNILYLNNSTITLYLSKENPDVVASLYIKDGINYTVRVDLGAYSVTHFECVFIELPVVHYRKEIVGCIYGASRQHLHLFNNKFDQLISKITTENIDLFLVG